jgi:hypothetical protein
MFLLRRNNRNSGVIAICYVYFDITVNNFLRNMETLYKLKQARTPCLTSLGACL